MKFRFTALAFFALLACNAMKGEIIYTDLRTGEEIAGSKIDQAELKPEVTMTSSDNKYVDFEVRVNYAAILEYSRLFGPDNAYTFFIPGVDDNNYSSRVLGYPDIPFVKESFEMPSGCDSIYVESVELETRDIECDLLSDETFLIPRTYTELMPFEGYYPENWASFSVWVGSYVNTIVRVALFKYSYEEKTVRAMVHGKFRVHFLKSKRGVIIVPPELEAEAAPRYYNLQGIEESNPQADRVYIERTGSTAGKVVK